MLIAIHILLFVAVFLFVATIFRAPIETRDESAFRIDVDNIDRDTVFEVLWMRPILVPAYHLVRRLNIPGFRKHVLKLLLALGNPHQYSPDEYIVICVLWGVIGSALTFLMARVVSGELGYLSIGLYLAAGWLAGFAVAYLWLRERALVRLRNIARRLPYALDLIAMAMDAGATFYEAAKAVVRDDPDDPLNEEFSIVIHEIDFGRSRQDALTHLGHRINVEGLDGILSAVLQAEALGTPLATVLKLQANLLRMRRSMRAERKAGEAAVKILVPSMLILISVVLIIFAPIIVRGIEGRYLQ
jgi:tight adherence protein C